MQQKKPFQASDPINSTDGKTETTVKWCINIL